MSPPSLCTCVAAAALLAEVALGQGTQTAPSPAVWGFDGERAGQAPAGFSLAKTGQGRAGRWAVKVDPSAPSRPNVLEQSDTDATDYRFPIAVLDGLSLRDLRLSVHCKPISGKVDQACGLVFRYRDPDDYYVVRANALENNIVLFHVVKGVRRPFKGWVGRVAAGVWHELRVDARGDHFEVYWEGKKIIDVYDKTFADPGKVGLWTKADSVTDFDDLSVTPLES